MKTMNLRDLLTTEERKFQIKGHFGRHQKDSVYWSKNHERVFLETNKRLIVTGSGKTMTSAEQNCYEELDEAMIKWLKEAKEKRYQMIDSTKSFAPTFIEENSRHICTCRREIPYLLPLKDN
jgi:phosphoribosylaminoimidazole-succinocarboxamide synthase